MYELLGPHVNQTYGGIPEMVAQWQPPVALIMDHAPAWHWVKGASPRTIMVGRWHHGEPPDYERIDPVAHARSQLAGILRAVADSPYDYIVGDNEPVIHSELAMRNLALYDIERMKILKRVGKKAAIGGLAAGNPGEMSLWAHYLPALEAAVEYGAVLHLHEYDWPAIGANDKWLPYRHELLYDGCPEHGWAGLPDRLKVPLIITEFGIDEGTVRPGRRHGWRSAGITPQAYMGQLEDGSRRLMQSPYVLGACIFCTGNASQDWVMFDFWPQVKELAAASTPQYRTYSIRPDVGPPPSDKIIGVDVSYWQRRFPWKRAVAEDNLKFAIMRSSVRTSVDRNLGGFWPSAKREVRKCGIYHYLYPEYVKEQARLFARLSLDHPANLVAYPDGRVGGYFLDVEQAGVTRDMVLTFKEVFEGESGLPLDYYTSAHKWGRLVGRGHRNVFGQIGWIADWRNVKRFAVPWGHARNGVKIRQFTSDNGVIRSYGGRLDVNEWVGSQAEFYAVS